MPPLPPRVEKLLSEFPDDEGNAGKVKWNFEKFLVAPDGKIVRRFRPKTEPETPKVVEAIESLLPPT